MPTEITFLLFAFQNDPGQSGFNPSLNFWLVIAGLLIIFFCLVSVFVPNIKALVSSPQEFSGLGVNMRVSILTVFVLMGFILSLSSFALQWQGFKTREHAYNETISRLKIEKEQAEERELRSRKFNINLALKPQGLNEELYSKEWECFYFLAERQDKPPDMKPHTAKVVVAKDGKSLKVFLEGLTQEAFIYSIKLKRKTDGKVWSVTGVTPLSEVPYVAEPSDEEEDKPNES